jgi:glycyl-tRNA synthetase
METAQEPEENNLLEKIVSLCKRRGFVFPGSEIYGGFAGTYDFGPLGVALRRNITDAWVNAMQEHDNIAQLDSSIVTSGKVWEASGHVHNFSDPLVACLSCGAKFRADHLLEKIGVSADEKMSEKELNTLFDAHRKELICPNCGKKNFDVVTNKYLLATTNLGMFSESEEQVYLRGETAQGIYINYKNILDTGNYKVPFGIAQVGKAFRNEINPRQFLFRKREFEQMEMQYFVNPKDAEKIYEDWRKERMNYYEKLDIKIENLKWKQHENLVFYAKAAWDIEYRYPFGWGELEGIHYRGDYDLTQHQKFSGVDMRFYDEETKEKYIPHIVETSVGVDRTMLMVLCDAYREDEMNGEIRTFLALKPSIAPVKVAVFPLLKNKPELVEAARAIYKNLKKEFGAVVFDDNGNIGKRYRRQDEIGTPFCVTIDFETVEKNAGVTIRDRDSGKQERIKVEDLIDYIREKIN